MSGTSADGADYSLCRISGRSIDLIRHWHVPYPAAIRKRVFQAAENAMSSHDLSLLHNQLGRFYARHTFPEDLKDEIELIGCHGQTIHHKVDQSVQTTLQIGDPSWLCAVSKAPVVHQFRTHDICLGGQGAPLATLLHYLLFAQKGKHVCVNNLGGVSNITSINWVEPSTPPLFLSFDTGPANMLMDALARHSSAGKRTCDRNGSLASRGKADLNGVNDLIRQDTFIRIKPPKSTGRERYGDPFFHACLEGFKAQSLSEYDQMATLTRFTAASIVENIRLHLPSPLHTLVLVGGGVKNPTLVREIEDCLSLSQMENTKVTTSEGLGWPVESIEAAAFALLACCRMDRVPGNISQTTGATHPCLLGSIAEI